MTGVKIIKNFMCDAEQNPPAAKKTIQEKWTGRSSYTLGKGQRATGQQQTM